MDAIQLDGKTLTISLASVGGLIGLTWFAGTTWASTKYEITENKAAIAAVSSDLKAQLADLAVDLQKISSLLDDAAEDRFRKQEMRRWAIEFQKENPELSVPDPSDEYLSALPVVAREP